MTFSTLGVGRVKRGGHFDSEAKNVTLSSRYGAATVGHSTRVGFRIFKCFD